MMPTFLISAYRFFFKVRFSAVTYLLNPSCRFYFTFATRLMLTFLVFIVVVWSPLMLDVDKVISSGEGPLVQLYALTSVFDYFYYFLFSSAEDSSDATSVHFESDDLYSDSVDMSMVFYQTELFDMDSDYENLEEEWEANGRPTYSAALEKGRYYKYSSRGELFSGPSLLHIDRDAELAIDYLKLLRDDYRFNLNRLSSIDRVYRSGFFDYGYEYDVVPDTLTGKQVFSLSPISETDFSMEGSDVVFDDIITVELSKMDKSERTILAGMDNSILGVDNVDLSFISYANEYSEDVYEDILQPNIRTSQSNG